MSSTPAQKNQPSTEARANLCGGKDKAGILFGTGMVALAIAVFAHLDVAAMVSTFVIGLIMAAGAALHLGYARRERGSPAAKSWTWSGVFYLAGSFAIMAEPIAGENALFLALAVALALSGMSRLVLGIQQSMDWIMIAGAATMLAAVAIGIGWPTSSLWMISALVALELLMQGIALIVTAVTRRTATPT